ncbi:MAG: HNH endonuclease [Lachnospiraceae bacterium]|nr:HNH endonuclease [Lachnospiraceae bacterium]
MPTFWKYPDEIADYIKEHVVGTTTRELTDQLNTLYSEKYGMNFTTGMIKSYKTNHHLKSCTRCGLPPGYYTKYPDGMLDYVRSIAQGRSSQELTDMVNAKYGEGTITVQHMKAYKKNHNINTGLTGQFEKGHEPANKGKKMSPEIYAKCAPTMFKKGQVPPNHMEVGECTHTTDGYLIRKVREDGTQAERFEFVHRAVWEEHNGPIPEGKMVSFLDGDKDNCSIDNLVLIDNEINLELNRRKLRHQEVELTRTGINIAKLSVMVRKAKQQRKKGGGIDDRSDEK